MFRSTAEAQSEGLGPVKHVFKSPIFLKKRHFMTTDPIQKRSADFFHDYLYHIDRYFRYDKYFNNAKSHEAHEHIYKIYN